MGVCGGLFIEDEGNCFEPNAVVELEQQTFDYSGSIEIYVVPENISSLFASLWRSGGGSCSNEGGYGAMMSGEIEVVPGQELQVLGH